MFKNEYLSKYFIFNLYFVLAFCLRSLLIFKKRIIIQKTGLFIDFDEIRIIPRVFTRNEKNLTDFLISIVINFNA